MLKADDILSVNYEVKVEVIPSPKGFQPARYAFD
jgi:hypothetical protein